MHTFNKPVERGRVNDISSGIQIFSRLLAGVLQGVILEIRIRMISSEINRL